MSTKYGIQPVPDQLKALDPQGFLDQLRKFALDTQAGRIAALASVSTSGTSPAPMPGPPGPPGPAAPPSEPDLTPPPTPVGTVTAGINTVYITTDAPTFTEGHGYNRTIVYGYKYGGSGPLPTFADAVVVHEFVGQVGSFSSDPGDQWHIWLKWRSNDGVLSTSPDGGANGHEVTTAKIGNVNLGPLIIEAGNLADGAITTAKFAAGIEPVSIVAALPSPSGYTGPKTVLLTTDGKLYRYVAGAWTAAVPTVDLVGQITSTQITDGAISTPKLAAGAVTAATIAANTITANEIAANAITASELAANSVVAGKIAAAAVSATEIAANAIQAVHLAANSIAVGTAAIQNGAIVNAMLANATITDAKIASLSASKLLAGSIAVGEYIQSSDFVTGVSGWRLGGNTAEIGSASLRGLLTASQIDARGLDIRNGAGEITFSANGLGVSRGGWVNSDPMLTAPSEWTQLVGPAVYTTNYAPLYDGLQNVWNVAGGTESHIYSARFPISPSKTYRIDSTLYQDSASGGNVYYLLVAFIDANGNAIDGSASGSPGWAGLGTYHYYVSASTMALGVNDFTFTFGPLGTGTIPPNAVSARVGILGNYGAASNRPWAWGGARVREIVDGNTLRITGSNVSTYIASAAIGNAQIGGTISSDNYVPGVSGWAIAKSGAAEFDAAFIRGKLTTDQLEVGSATAISQVASLGQAGSFANTSLQTVGPFSIATGVPTTGAGLNFSGTFTIDISTIGMSASVASMVVSADIKVGSTVWVTSRTRVSRQPTGTPTIGTIVTLPMIARLVMAPGSYDFTLSISVWFLDSSGNAVTPGTAPSYLFDMVGWFVENKV